MMLKKGSFLVVLLILVCQLLAKDTIRVRVYDTSGDFIARKSKHGEVMAILKDKGNNHLEVKKIIDPITNKKVKDFKFIWAIEYESAYYVNMVYSDDQTFSGMYIKLDIVGDLYCATKMDKRLPIKMMSDAEALVYGGGILGILAASANGHRGHECLYPINEKEEIPILYIDLSEIEIRYFSKGRNEGSLFNYLCRKKLKKLLKKHEIHHHDEPTAEEVFDLIEKMNDGRKY